MICKLDLNKAVKIEKVIKTPLALAIVSSTVWLAVLPTSSFLQEVGEFSQRRDRF